jgi:septum formation protein
MLPGNNKKFSGCVNLNLSDVNWFPSYNYILASKSPRRIQLLRDMGIPFTVQPVDIPESYPSGLGMLEIPVYLAREKARPFEGQLHDNDLLITADTIVWLRRDVLGKPSGKDEARVMLRKLSGHIHQVVTGVCLKSNVKERTFHAVTHVEFKELTDKEIDYYVTHFDPTDKAGAYGIQEWIGMAGITRVEGSYYNVVGLPVQRLYTEIMGF